MATPQNNEPLKIIGSISKFAGTLVGTAVITGKRIIHSTIPPSKGQLNKSGKKTMQAPTKRKKKKVVKRKGTGSSSKGGVSKKKPVQSPAKKKKATTPGKKTTRHKTKKIAKSEASSHSENSLTSKTGAGMNAPIEK